MLKINLGCGSQILEGWVNVDYSLGAKMAKIPIFNVLNRRLNLFSLEWDDRIFIHDLRKPFPWKDATVDVIYSSHTLEHFTREDGLKFLQECFRVLKPNGTIRILVPDLAVTVSHYLCGKTRADYFVEGLGVLYTPCASPLKKLLNPVIDFPHKCHYDAHALTSILNEIGFQAMSMNAFESSIADIKQIELKDRTENAIMIEGIKEPGISSHLQNMVKSISSAAVIPEAALHE